jgi:anthranilate phosphoribosyltransferase
MQNLHQTLEHLLNGVALSEPEAARLLERLTAADLSPALAGALLAALRAKGVVAAELRGFAGAMRSLARRPALPADLDAIDIVGTGGDFSGSLNLSTGAALLAASCGLPVVKHGNRSVTSQSGSADLIEQLGIALPLDEQRAAQWLAGTGFTFLFAPYYHPAMKALAPVRAALGVRTVLNLLGPLTNPAAPRYRLIGAYDEASARLIADALAGMPIARAWVVHGANGWDEATPVGPFVAFDVTPGAVSRRMFDPAELGVQPCMSGDLEGGDAAANCRAMRAVFAGSDTGPHRSALVLQCGLALHIAGRSASVVSGIQTAGEALDSGRASAWLARFEQFSAPGGGAPSAGAASASGAAPASGAAAATSAVPGVAGATGAMPPAAASGAT